MAAPVLHSTVPAPVQPFSVRSFITRCQDTYFEALAELRYAVDRLTLAARWDDQESQIERAVFNDMERCGCRCCGAHLPRLLRADAYDHQERSDGWEQTSVRVLATADFLRRGSSDVERTRLSVIGSRQTKLRMVER